MTALKRNTNEYKNLHARIKRARGAARFYKCVDCGGDGVKISYGIHNMPVEE